MYDSTPLKIVQAPLEESKFNDLQPSTENADADEAKHH